jgi:FtsP/CotA-like multicopper oxidase with cupredoxin domain
LGGTGRAEEIVEPIAFASENGVLDLLMIAQPKPVQGIAFTPPTGSVIHPTGWVYEVCRRPPTTNHCPSGSATVADYGGVRLALQRGDTLKTRLVNRLPLLDPTKLAHARDPGGAELFRNPTSLHTHGLLVEAREPTATDPTYGDFVFVSIYNPANGKPAPHPGHDHGRTEMDFADYRIEIPPDHPSGLFWFHPHAHGLSVNQLSSGLSGLLTIGEVSDYAHGDTGGRPVDAEVRHLILEDMQVLAAGTIGFAGGSAAVADGEVLHQQDPDFCAQYPASAEAPRLGSCAGTDTSAESGNNYTGGRWYFTVNGQTFPTITSTAPDGEIWRLANASASLSYHLRLVDDATEMPMIMQLVAVDGASVGLPQDTAIDTLVELAGARFTVVRCPAGMTTELQSLPVCIDSLVMMPSSRAELWVTYRDAEGRRVEPPRGATATFKMVGLTMGSGDAWPAVDLARVAFEQHGASRGVRAALDIGAARTTATSDSDRLTASGARAQPARLPPGCKALPDGHRRRIFFGLEDLADDDSFALGYEEVDRDGRPVPETQVPVTRFDPMKEIVCLPLGPAQQPVRETWELVQLSTENHNFHIHQARFRNAAAEPPGGSRGEDTAVRAGRGGIVQDNIPLGVAVPAAEIRDRVMNDQNGVCAVEQWRAGLCASRPVLVDISFSQLGVFMYHCHILEHQDGGMMAKIRVVASPR